MIVWCLYKLWKRFGISGSLLAVRLLLKIGVRRRSVVLFVEDIGMGWFLLSGFILALGYLFYARSKKYLSATQVRQIQDLLEREALRIKVYRQEVIQRNGERGKTIPLEQVVLPLEKSKVRYKDDLKYVAAVERTIGELKRRYQRHIPVDEI